MTITLLLFLIAGDIPISTLAQDQAYPVVVFAHDQFYIFWDDLRHYPSERSIYGARVTETGNVIDPLGQPILIDRTVSVAAACDGVNFLAVIQDSC